MNVRELAAHLQTLIEQGHGDLPACLDTCDGPEELRPAVIEVGSQRYTAVDDRYNEWSEGTILLIG